MITNNASEKMVLFNPVTSYTMIFSSHSTSIDPDLLGKHFWITDTSDVLIKEWPVTDPAQVSTNVVTIVGLLPGTTYKFSGSFYDKMIDPELLAAKFGIFISDVTTIATKIPITFSDITVNLTLVEVGVSNPTVNFFFSGDAEFIEIESKLETATEWEPFYVGQVTNPLSLIAPIGKYYFRVRGGISLPDGVTIEKCAWYEYPELVDIKYLAIPPSKPTSITFKTLKINDGVERYDLKVSWDWVQGTGAQIKQFILEYTPTSTYDTNQWAKAQQINTASSTDCVITNFPFNKEYKFRVIADAWGPVDGSMQLISDTATHIITSSTPLDDSFTTQTGVEVTYSGIFLYNGTGGSRVQTYKLDALTGNVSIGILDAGGKVPFIFDAVNNILSISGKTITESINSANFILTNTSGTPPKLYAQEKPTYGSPNQGIWMGYESQGSAKFKFDLGDSAQYMRWDGTQLRISSSVTIGTPSGDIPLGDAMKGKFQVYIYQVGTTLSPPALPPGTLYPPSGWYVTPPSYNPNTQVLWTSTGTLDPLTNVISGAWSTPVQFTGGNGLQGPLGPAGGNGLTGQRGPGMYLQSMGYAIGLFDPAAANTFFNNLFGSGPVRYDVLTQYTYNNPAQLYTKMWDGASWVTPALVVHGNMIVNGTVRAEAMVADNAFFLKAGINVIYDRNAALSADPEGTYKMKIDLATGYLHIR